MNMFKEEVIRYRKRRREKKVFIRRIGDIDK